MALEARLLTGLALSIAVVYWTTPLAIRVADRFEFYDRPRGYRGHAAPTPYLGGAAVVFGFLLAIVLLTGDLHRTLPVASGVVVLWAVGTIDDRWTLAPGIRVLVEVGLATALWRVGASWELGFGAGIDWAVTVVWIVAVVNAFNLFDNMDGAASSMACVVSGALALLGIVQGDTWLSVVAAALCGACAGFLPHNLSSPARIFLGDGGSMPIGFAVAVVAMIGVGDAAREWQSLAMGLLFVGVPALDTCLVIVSRKRRGLSILTGGRDHLTHRAQKRLQTTRAVAITLGGVQAVVSALAIVAIRGGSVAVVGAVVVYLVSVGVAIAVLDTRLAVSESTDTASSVGAARRARRRRPLATRRNAVLALLVALGVGIGVSPFFFGYYDAGIWVPAGLALLTALTAGLIARPPELDMPGLLAVVGLLSLALWALASSFWADSVEQAMIGGNRLLVYVVLLGLVVVLARSDVAGAWLLGALTATVVGVAGFLLGQMLLGDGDALFLRGRLNSPLGYVNGEATFFLLAIWPCIAAAEQRRSRALGAAGVAAASILGALLALTGSRGALLAAAVSALVVLALIPGRARRAWVLLVVVSSVVIVSPVLLDVAGANRSVFDGAARSAAGAALLSALAASIVWAILATVARAADARVLRLATVGVFGVALAAVLAVGVGSRDSISRSVDRQYNAFVSLQAKPALDSGASRLLAGGGNRYDYWRIAWKAWQDEPLHGLGAGNYDVAYFAHRTTLENVRQPHSLPLQTLSELGIIGGALLVMFLIGISIGAWRTARAARETPPAHFIAVASIGMVTAWLAHTTVDWIHLLPGVTAAAVIAAGLVLRPRAQAVSRARTTTVHVHGRIAAAALIAAMLTLTGVSLSRQGMADYFRGEAREALAKNPATTLLEADRSLRLDPEAVSAYQLKAAALARFNKASAARAALLEATRREPSDFVTWALLGDLAVRMGDVAQARDAYRHAHRLNPRDTTLAALSKNPEAAASGIAKREARASP
jgi:UDP-GlcNAc:undecaprenyl-phosphate GlcNAc-1-phosphate transferase